MSFFYVTVYKLIIQVHYSVVQKDTRGQAAGDSNPYDEKEGQLVRKKNP